jgi:hypothetical protein
LAVIFKQYSVERDVSNWASDERVAGMSLSLKNEVYRKAQKRARELIRGSITLLTLTMVGEIVPFRLVRRGRETFGGLGM